MFGAIIDKACGFGDSTAESDQEYHCFFFDNEQPQMESDFTDCADRKCGCHNDLLNVRSQDMRDCDGTPNLFRNKQNNEFEMVVGNDCSKFGLSPPLCSMQEEEEPTKNDRTPFQNSSNKMDFIGNNRKSSRDERGSLDRREQDSIERESDTTFSRQTGSNSSAHISSESRSTKTDVTIRSGKVKEKSKATNRKTPSRISDFPSTNSGKNKRSPNLSGLRRKLFPMKNDSGKHDGWKVSNVPPALHLRSMSMDSSAFTELCGIGFNSPTDVRIALERDPTLAKKVSVDGRVPLHALCSKCLPIRKTKVVSLRNFSFNFDSMTTVVHAQDRSRSFEFDPDKSIDFSSHETEHVQQIPLKVLQEDARNFKDLLNIVLDAFPDASIIHDRNGDLPVHILARKLWDWGQQMRPRGYGKQKRLYEFWEISLIIRDCIEALLLPLLNDKKLCQSQGSKGVLLPLHIGALYGVSIHIIEGLLNGFMGATKMETYGSIDGVENKLALDLFENEQFYRMEVYEEGMYDFGRRSDLIFSSNPSLLPYRREPERLIRIENWIREEAKTNSKEMSRHVSYVWQWMCTFSNIEDDKDNYASNIKAILSGIDFLSMKKLVCSKVGKDKSVMDVAVSPCFHVLVDSITEKHHVMQ